jgi:negative regulator of replication initiation
MTSKCARRAQRQGIAEYKAGIECKVSKVRLVLLSREDDHTKHALSQKLCLLRILRVARANAGATKAVSEMVTGYNAEEIITEPALRS